MSPQHTDAGSDDSETMPLDDERVPQAVRAYGRQFDPPARFVQDWGAEEYALLASDGEVLDIICFETQPRPNPTAVALVVAVGRLPAAWLYVVPFLLFLVLPSVVFLFQGLKTGSFHLLMAGLLLSLASAVVWVIWRMLLGTR